MPGVPAKVAREVYDHLHKTAAPSDAAAAREAEREGAWS